MTDKIIISFIALNNYYYFISGMAIKEIFKYIEIKLNDITAQVNQFQEDLKK